VGKDNAKLAMRGGGVVARWTLVLSALACVSLFTAAQSDGIEFVEGRFSEMIGVDFRATTLADVLSSETELQLRILWDAVEFEPAFHLSELQSSSLQLSTWVQAGHIQFRSLLAFDLVKPQSHFLHFEWQSNAFGVTYGPTFLLVHNPWDPTPEDLKMDFEFHGQTVAGMAVTLVATFGTYVDPTVGSYVWSLHVWPNTGNTDGICDLPFVAAEIQVNGFQFCCAQPSVSISFDASGFDNITFSVSDVRIENLPWLTLSGALIFSTETKSMTISPAIDFGAFEGCLSVVWAYSGVTTGNPPSGATPTVESIDIIGLRLECSLGSVNIWGELRAASSDRIAINNYDRDFDPDTDCCEALQWQVYVGFSESSDSLFDVSSFSASLRHFMTQRFMWTAAMYVNTSTVSPSSTWTFGFEIRFGPSFQ
jgi:hypothetical protein